MKLFSLLVVCSSLSNGCATQYTEMEEIEREYEYQVQLEEFRIGVMACRQKGGYIFIDNPVRYYRKGIENHPHPDRFDMKHTYCMEARRDN